MSEKHRNQTGETTIQEQLFRNIHMHREEKEKEKDTKKKWIGLGSTRR